MIVRRLFYAGAAQGQMPEMLTMVTPRATPAPAVLAVALLSLLYLTFSDIYALINYVGFATWVRTPSAHSCPPFRDYTLGERSITHHKGPMRVGTG
jgi:amino acid permease